MQAPIRARAGRPIMADSLLWPDVVLPAQQVGRACAVPERKLALAVLENGIVALRLPQVTANQRRRGYSPRDEAISWISSDDTSWPFSFRNLCDLLGLDAGWLRGRLASRGLV